jgi:hypothetical protein
MMEYHVEANIHTKEEGSLKRTRKEYEICVRMKMKMKMKNKTQAIDTS